MKSWERTQSKVQFVDWVELKDESPDEVELYAQYIGKMGDLVYVSFQRDLSDGDSYAWQWTHTIDSSDWDKGYYH